MHLHKHDDREREYARRLASAINVERSSDYQPVDVSDEDFPDFYLKSAKGLKRLAVEVVTVPVSDYAARQDTGIQKRLRRKLQERFSGHPGLVIEINLRKKGLTHNVRRQQLESLIGIVEALIGQRDARRGFATTRVMGTQHHNLQEFLFRASVHTLPHQHGTPYVWFPLCYRVPSDCRWILEGIEHKLCYPLAILQQTILVVGDMGFFGERDEVDVCKANGAFSQYPFKEIWFASVFFPIPGIMRLK